MTEQGPDQVMVEIGQALELFRNGDPAQARARFDQLWETMGGSGADPFHRCALAHYAADTQDTVAAELDWDLRALAAADEVTDARAQQYHHTLAVTAFYPSLHLNLAEDYRKLGELSLARQHIESATEHTDALGDDDYGQTIRDGIERCAAAISDASAAT